jgi:hypothetical protein
MFYHILTRCTACSYYAFVTIVHPIVLCHSLTLVRPGATQGASQTDSYLLYIFR